MKRALIIFSSATLLVACGEPERNPNSVTIDENSSMNMQNQNNSTATNSATNNSTNNSSTNNTATNNTSTNGSTNNASTNNNTQTTLAVEGTIVAGEMPPQLPIVCGVRLYTTTSVNPSDADLFVTPARQVAITVDRFPFTWSVTELNRGDRFYAGVLCDRDDDQQFDNIGGWHVDSTDVPTTVTVPAADVEIGIGTFSL